MGYILTFIINKLGQNRTNLGQMTRHLVETTKGVCITFLYLYIMVNLYFFIKI